jgi:diguanylate cyclase (GGDEF)-like protein
MLALTALVAVFSALLRRQSDTDLRLWLVGWVLIVIHFIAKLPDDAHQTDLLSAITIWTLELGGYAFMWAALLGRRFSREAIPYAVALAVPQLIYSSLANWNVEDVRPYAVLAIVGAVFPIAMMARARSPRLGRAIGIGACLVLCVALLVNLAVSSDRGGGISIILTWIYIAAAIACAMSFRRKHTGVLTVILGFVAWALVFPISWALQIYDPKLHIDDAAWNIPKYIVAIGIIVTMLEEQMVRAHHLALHDPLTGLANRRMLDRRLDDSLQRARKNGTQFALLAIDLDDFKSVNDILGHRAGDDFLRVVGERLARHSCGGSLCVRYGGDEFIVLADDVGGRHDAERIATDVVASITQSLTLCGREIVPSASIGIAVFPDDGSAPDELHAASDRAMYAAKQSRQRRASIA